MQTDFRVAAAAAVFMTVMVLVGTWLVRTAAGDEPERTDVAELIRQGQFAAAEAALRAQIAEPEAPVVGPAARQLEILRRTRMDFTLSAADVLQQIQADLPDATAAEVQQWTDDNLLEHRLIDGEVRYFRRAAGNLFRLDADARRRRDAARAAAADKSPDNQEEQSESTPEFNLREHVRNLVQLAKASDDPLVAPVQHRVKYTLTVNADHPRVKPGAVVRVWLPYPQQYRQQRDVRLVSSSPGEPMIASAEAPQRTAYFEQAVRDAEQPLEFAVEFSFVTSAYCPKITAAAVEPYDRDGETYRTYTAERLPHIALTSDVRALAAEIVGDETNPLEKARRVFRWVSANIPWCGEMEYSIIPSLSAKGLAARRGDCGVQGMTFITLCRAAGVPARWQSGWQTKPGKWNMHDWSEFFVEPWGWLPADASYGVIDDPDPRVADFFCGRMDPYRLIVNRDYARELQPAKTSFRSEPNDFQRGEVEIDGHNLYFDEWDYQFEVETQPAK